VELREALFWLEQHINLEANAGRPAGASLERMKQIAYLLGDPHEAYPSIHITGTNGKGSTARLTTSLLIASGLNVGTYTSPHLERLNERISQNLNPISDEDLGLALGAIAAIEPMLDGPPSHFEILTGAAFRWFADIAIDAAVLEVGMLGRYDCTNIVNAPVSVLTRVAADHTDGSEGWRQAIALEKVGIVKAGSTFVLGETHPDLAEIFASVPAAQTWLTGRDYAVEDNRVAVGGRLLTIRTPGARYEDLFLPLHGAHQGDNAAAALVAVEAFFGRPLEEEVVVEAFANASVPGRLEVVAHSPTVLLDAAHNPDGAEALTQALAESFTPMGSRYLVTGVLEQKDPVEMFEALDATSFDLVIVCTPDTPRARPAAEVAQVAASMGITVEAVADPVEAVARAVTLADEQDLVVVAGSIFLIGAVRGAYTRRAEVLLAAQLAADEAEEESYHL